jgi:hypothetical protein
MLSGIARYWRRISAATLLSLPNIWQGIKWVWDWLGRLDLFAGHIPDVRGLSPVTEYLTTPRHA